jgi:hypothetical protein
MRFAHFSQHTIQNMIPFKEGRWRPAEIQKEESAL